MLLLKLTKVTTDNQKITKFGLKKYKSYILHEGLKKALVEGQSPPQEFEEGPRSGPHLLVYNERANKMNFKAKYIWRFKFL